MTIYEIQLSPANQSFQLQLVNTIYNFLVQWNSQTETWQIDISDNSGAPIVTGIPMVGNVDLLEQYAYMGIGGALIASTDNAPDMPPTFENLGTTGHLYFVTP